MSTELPVTPLQLAAVLLLMLVIGAWIGVVLHRELAVDRVHRDRFPLGDPRTPRHRATGPEPARVPRQRRRGELRIAITWGGTGVVADGQA